MCFVLSPIFCPSHCPSLGPTWTHRHLDCSLRLRRFCVVIKLKSPQFVLEFVNHGLPDAQLGEEFKRALLVRLAWSFLDWARHPRSELLKVRSGAQEQKVGEVRCCRVATSSSGLCYVLHLEFASLALECFLEAHREAYLQLCLGFQV